ncbi:B12-binding domain-containing radical SAM protein [Kribbella sp. NPDC004875]|uniref:B12-binding domain-containing radical SAM protein n=1 Tax=Kribbella sp. NPDC004875 TaxID=3364107 RepID=UPI0036B715C9
MKVVLISPPIMDDFGGDPRPIAMDAVRECPAYGMYLLQAVLHAHGHDATLVDLISDGSDRIDTYLRLVAEAGLVGIGATSMSWPTALSVIGQIRAARPDVPIVLGGIHPTMFDEYLLRTFPVQYVVRGEGERAIVELANAVQDNGDLAGVANLSWVSESGELVRNPVARQLSAEDLAAAPLPDYNQLRPGLFQGLSIESSRGCAFDCSFCSTSYRRSYRSIEPEAFVDRLEAVSEYTGRTNTGFVHIIDDEFSMNPRRAVRIAESIRRRGMTPSLVYDSRATDLLFPGYVESIAEFTGQFLVGAECGYDEGLERIGKGTTTDILERAAQKLMVNGIADRADFSFILGLPWETVTEVRRTIAFAAKLYATYGVRLLLQWYCQIPGSRLWQEQRDRLDVSEVMYDEFGFFRNLYLFRSGVRLTPEEIWDVSRQVRALMYLSRARNPERVMIEYGHPEPISLYFPEDLVRGTSHALPNLRTVAYARDRNTGKERRADGARRPLRHLPL